MGTFRPRDGKYKGHLVQDLSFGDTSVGDELTLHCTGGAAVGGEGRGRGRMSSIRRVGVGGAAVRERGE